MPLPITVESLESVPEPLRVAYVERDGRWVLDADGLDDVERVKAALQKERQLHREAAKRATALERELESAKHKDDDPRVQALRAQLAEYESKIAEMQAAMSRRDAESALRQQALAAGVDPRHVAHLLRLIDGRWERRGDEFVFSDESGTPVADDLAAFFGKRLAKEFPFFYGRAAAGSGSPQSAGGSALTLEQIDRMTPEEVRARWAEVKKALGG